MPARLVGPAFVGMIHTVVQEGPVNCAGPSVKLGPGGVRPLSRVWTLVTMSSSSTPHSEEARSPREEIIDDNHSEASNESVEEQHEVSMAALEKQKFLARREVEFDVPDEVWLQERRCLLMLLEARMLLRELVEYKVKMMRTASGNLTISEIQNLLALYSENDEDADFISGTRCDIILHTYFGYSGLCLHQSEACAGSVVASAFHLAGIGPSMPPHSRSSSRINFYAPLSH